MKKVRLLSILYLIFILSLSSKSVEMGDYCYLPPFLSAGAPPNIMLMLSIETPMQGAAHPDITCSGDPKTSYSCSPASCRYRISDKDISNCYDNTKDYYGYFDSGKCYEYSNDIFVPSGNSSNHQCSGKWSGNFLNWAITMAVDAMRKAFTGGNRNIDSSEKTQLLGARQTLNIGHSWFPIKRIDNAQNYTPYSGTIYLIRYENGFVVCKDTDNDGLPDCGIEKNGSGENSFPTVSNKRCNNDIFKACNNDSDCGSDNNPKCQSVSGNIGAFKLQIEVCNPSKGLESNCVAYKDGNTTIYKPEGVLQKYSNKIRFGLISYAMKNNPDKSRDGGIIRANIKWISTKIPNGLKYHDQNGNIMECSNVYGCDNPVKEINSNGTFVSNPDNISNAKSGVINYINKFGYESGYKSYDPISEMYYQIVRYFKNQGPTNDRVCSGLDNTDDGFAVYCNQSSQLSWRDPYLYSCQQSFVVAINDANPWLDKRIPGTSFTSTYTDYDTKANDYGEPDNSLNVSEWTKKVGDYEGITPGSMCIGCVLDGTCDWQATSKNVTDLSKVAGTCPYPPKQNSYYIAGLAYYAHNEDLRPDLPGKQNLYTYMIDTQESNNNMLVGRYNMLYLAAKFGSFDDINNNGKPDLAAEWDKDNDGFPDGYFFASNPTKIEDGLKKTFEEILKKTSAGTSVSIISERGSSGATVSQAFFYPEVVYGQNKLSWIGKLQTYWFYNSKSAQNIREDTNTNKILDISTDGILDFNVDDYGNLSIDYYQSNPDGTRGSKVGSYSSLDNIKTLFEAGELLKNRQASNRTIYAISKNNSLTPSIPLTMDNFIGSNYSNFSDYFKLGNQQYCFDGPSGLIDYIRGEDKQGCRVRQTGSGTWKLGDIVYSSPRIVNYGNYSVLYVGANDGMLHAFKVGKLRRDGLSEGQVIKLCQDSSSTCEFTEIGKELWGFVPRHVMPYLKYLADPRYCHLNFVDLPPYVIEEDLNGDGVIDKRILIGGLRFGGSCGCHSKKGNKEEWCDPSKQVLPDCDVSSINSCVGLSSYFALDITDPLDPKFLWEFTDPYLGFSYSGPAYIKHSNRRYVMFLSGPTNFRGEVAEDNGLNIYFLKLRDDFTIDSIKKIDGQGKYGFTKFNELASYKQAFGGRLFTNGLDANYDGNTDIVLFGVNQFTGSVWQGNVIGIKPNSNEPDKWTIFNLFNSAIEPITVKIEHMNCFGMNYIYFGTGRWFYKTDEAGKNEQDKEKIYGIRIDGCLSGNNCSLNSAHNSSNACKELGENVKTTGWYLSNELLAKGGGYNKERVITDPTVSPFNIVFITSMQPTEDVCKFGGRSRVWGLNCATGAAVSDASCPGYVPAPPPPSTLLLQLSGGNIEQIPTSSFGNNKTTGWYTGTPPEPAPPFTPAGGARKGEMILWIER